MCLAVPMKIDSIEPDLNGMVSLNEVSYRVNFSLIDSPVIGDYVIVHAGFAIEKLDTQEAHARLELFEELAKSLEEEA